MASLYVEGTELVVGLSALEKLGGLVGTVRVPLTAIREVRAVEKSYPELRGIRVGTGIPWVIVLGRMMSFDGTDYVAVYGTGPAAVVELEAQQAFRRLVISGVSDDDLQRVQVAVEGARAAA